MLSEETLQVLEALVHLPVALIQYSLPPDPEYAEQYAQKKRRRTQELVVGDISHTQNVVTRRRSFQNCHGNFNTK